MLTAIAMKGRDKPYNVSDGLKLYLYVVPIGAKYSRLNNRHRQRNKPLSLFCFHHWTQSNARCPTIRSTLRSAALAMPRMK